MDWYWLALMLLVVGLLVMVAAWEGWPMKETGSRHERGSPVRTALLPADFPLRQRSVRHRLSRIGRRTSIVAALLIAAVVTWLFTPFAAVVFLALIVLLELQDRENSRAERFKDAVRASNTRLRISIKLTETLRHPAVRRLLDRLKQVGRVDSSLTEEQWTASLVEAYQERSRREDQESEEVVFHIRGERLWVNGRLCETDSLYHEIVIPYESVQQVDREHVHEDDVDRAALRLRVLVVNGLLKLQVGRFDRSLSPERTPKADGGEHGRRSRAFLSCSVGFPTVSRQASSSSPSFRKVTAMSAVWKMNGCATPRRCTQIWLITITCSSRAMRPQRSVSRLGLWRGLTTNSSWGSNGNGLLRSIRIDT